MDLKKNTVEYGDFISNIVKTDERNMLISQSIRGDIFSGIFGVHKRYKSKATSWWKSSKYDNILEYVEREWKNDKQIFSLEADDITGSFYVYLVAGFGNGQSIIYQLSDIKKKWDDGQKITSITSEGSKYYIVMTGHVYGYQGQAQSYFTRNSWSEVSDEIGKHYKDKKIVTSICYNEVLHQYLVVMTQSFSGQSMKWCTNQTEINEWMDDMFENKKQHPTIVFKDPNFDKILVVMTTDSTRSNYLMRTNYQLE